MSYYGDANPPTSLVSSFPDWLAENYTLFTMGIRRTVHLREAQGTGLQRTVYTTLSELSTFVVWEVGARSHKCSSSYGGWCVCLSSGTVGAPLDTVLW